MLGFTKVPFEKLVEIYDYKLEELIERSISFIKIQTVSILLYKKHRT